MFTTVAFAIECHYMFMVYSVFIYLFLGVCRFFIAFADDLTSRLSILEIETQAFSSGIVSKPRSQRNMKRIIHGFIQFHSDVKQLSDSLIKVFIK